MKTSFNVRVYGICYREDTFLALDEEYAGADLLKLPGGGLEYGEGLIECLQRELKEELNLEAKAFSHLYTQEDFVVSRFNSSEQLLTIYYECELVNPFELLIKEPSVHAYRWLTLRDDNPFTLPVDRQVFDLLKSRNL